MKLLFIFLDGVGLGADDPRANPLARADMPHLQRMLGGQRLVGEVAPFRGEHAALLALDASLGVPGLPQSASGQATLLSGRNVPAELGYHYGPKPNHEIATFLQNGNLFSTLRQAGKSASFINAYPPGYFSAIQSGRRLYAAIPLAATSAGMRLRNTDDLIAGQALAADFTARGWHAHLGIDTVPVLEPEEAGEQLGRLASACDFTLFEYWLSDYAGHRQDMDGALNLLATLDRVLGGLAGACTRRHTPNPVPALIIGPPEKRRHFTRSLRSLTDVTPAILAYLGVDQGQWRGASSAT